MKSSFIALVVFFAALNGQAANLVNCQNANKDALRVFSFDHGYRFEFSYCLAPSQLNCAPHASQGEVERDPAYSTKFSNADILTFNWKGKQIYQDQEVQLVFAASDCVFGNE